MARGEVGSSTRSGCIVANAGVIRKPFRRFVSRSRNRLGRDHIRSCALIDTFWHHLLEADFWTILGTRTLLGDKDDADNRRDWLTRWPTHSLADACYAQLTSGKNGCKSLPVDHRGERELHHVAPSH